MTIDELIIETENGEQFIANIKSMDFEVNMAEYGQRVSSIDKCEYTFEVGTLINVESGEEY